MEKVTHSIEVPEIGTVNINIENEPNGVYFDYAEGTNTRRVFLHNPQTNRNRFKLSFPFNTKLLDGNGADIESAAIGIKYDADVVDEDKYRFFSEMPTTFEILMKASVNHLLLHKWGVRAFDPENNYEPIIAE